MSHDSVKHILDTAAVGTAVATFFQILPDITALAALIYLLLRIYEMETVQKFLRRRHRK